MADRLIQYLRKHYRENLTVEQIATHFNYHAGHINRVMRRSTGTTIHNYLVRCRMDAAKTLLLSTDMTVSQVAEEVGIESEAYFCNSFKKLTGITPKEYRRRAKNQ
jgi:YesN/AraC family two-component response regulator